MGYTFKQLKECAENIARDCGIEYADAARVVGSWQGGAECGRAIAGDYGDVWRACDLLGIKYKKPRKRSAAADQAKRDIKGGADQAAGVEVVAGEIVPAEFTDGLPDDISRRVMDALSDYCEQFQIEDISKERQPRWSAACIYIGKAVFKGTDLLRDMRPDARRAGSGLRAYDIEKISAVADFFLYLCGAFVKAPFIDDFCHFASITDSWLYGAGTRNDLTPGKVALLQKLRDAQERGLAGMIADGRQNPTGALAILNHWHNWVQVREIVHTDAASSSAAVLPDFGAPPMLTEKP